METAPLCQWLSPHEITGNKWCLKVTYFQLFNRVSRHDYVKCILSLYSCIFMLNKAFGSWNLSIITVGSLLERFIASRNQRIVLCNLHFHKFTLYCGIRFMHTLSIKIYFLVCIFSSLIVLYHTRTCVYNTYVFYIFIVETWKFMGYSIQKYMMTSSNGSIFRVTGHLWGEFKGPRWIPRTKASDAALWCFLWSASE